MRIVRFQVRRPQWTALAALASAVVLLASCSALGSSVHGPRPPGRSTISSSAGAHHVTTTSRAATSTSTTTTTTTVVPPRLPVPQPLTTFAGLPAGGGQGVWAPAGRPVRGLSAVYETTLVPPGGSQVAGIAWMDTRLLSARLYSGSISPGGGPFRFTAPVLPQQATSLVAAFNGGFQMRVARGGYYTEGRLVYPLVAGAASLVIYANGSVALGAWDRNVAMTPSVVAVRQNLVPLVADGRPTAQAASADWQSWGATCGATSCLPTVPGIEHQWRSGLGVTADGALVYVIGPALDPLQLAQLLVRAGAVRGMQLDINPYWTVFVTYDPLLPGALAAPANGSKLLATTEQGPATFFEPSWARDFIAMSSRSASTG